VDTTNLPAMSTLGLHEFSRPFVVSEHVLCGNSPLLPHVARNLWHGGTPIWAFILYNEQSSLCTVPSTPVFLFHSSHRRYPMFRSIAYCFSILFIAMMAGYGSGDGHNLDHVEGMVTLDGEPVSGASVAFVPTGDNPLKTTATGVSNEKGIYRLFSQTQAGVAAGEYKVLIAKTTEPRTEDFSDTRDLLPGLYRNLQRTPLTAIVNKKGQNKINFELKSNP